MTDEEVVRTVSPQSPRVAALVEQLETQKYRIEWATGPPTDGYIGMGLARNELSCFWKSLGTVASVIREFGVIAV